MRRLLIIIAGLGLAMACAPPTPGQPAASSGVRGAAATAQVAPAVARAGESPSEAPAAAEEAPRADALVQGTYPGPYVRGRADAPVTIEEYADFQ